MYALGLHAKTEIFLMKCIDGEIHRPVWKWQVAPAIQILFLQIPAKTIGKKMPEKVISFASKRMIANCPRLRRKLLHVMFTTEIVNDLRDVKRQSNFLPTPRHALQSVEAFGSRRIRSHTGLAIAITNDFRADSKETRVSDGRLGAVGSFPVFREPVIF